MSDDYSALLLNAFASGSSRELILQQILQQADPDDPTMALLTRYLTQSATSSDNEQDEEAGVEAEHVQRLTELLEDVSDKLRRVYEEVAQLRDENEALVRSRSILAAALGICYECFGEDPDCPICAGQGYPGSGFYEPDDEYFWHYVAPAVRVKEAIRQANQRRQ